MIGERRVIAGSCTDEVFETLMAQSGELQGLIGAARGTLACFSMVAREIFYQLYRNQRAPGAAKGHRVSGIFSQLAAEGILGRERSGALFTAGYGDLFGAGLGVLYLGREFMLNLPPQLADLANRIWRLETRIERQHLAVKASDKVIEVLTGLGQFALKMAYARKVEYLEGARLRSEEELKGLEERMLACFRIPERAGQLALARMEGEKKLAPIWSALEGWSGIGGCWKRGEFDQAVEMARKLAKSPKLGRIARRLCKIRELAREQAGEVFSDKPVIGQGNDLSRVLPEDLALSLRHRPVFYRRFWEEDLWEFREDGNEETGRGYILCLDNSGSMEGPKEEVGKALALALWEIDRLKQREQAVIMFGGPDDPLQIFRLLPGSSTLADAVAIGEMFLRSRSTDFAKPLEAALELMESHPQLRGGIVFITDGICRLREDFLKSFQARKETMGFQVTGIVVTYGQATIEGLSQFCDRILVSTDLLGHDILADLNAELLAGS